MGGGGLRILPHKSWNVYGWKQRQRVARDEAKARADEEEKKARNQAAEQEYRVDLLRQRASRRRTGKEAEEELDETEDKAESPTHKRARGSGMVVIEESREGQGARETEVGHINLFADSEASTQRAMQARDKEEQRHANEIAWLKRNAPTVFFGAQAEKPWYGGRLSKQEAADEIQNRDEEVDLGTKHMEDPLSGVSGALGNPIPNPSIHAATVKAQRRAAAHASAHDWAQQLATSETPQAALEQHLKAAGLDVRNGLQQAAVVGSASSSSSSSANASEMKNEARGSGEKDEEKNDKRGGKKEKKSGKKGRHSRSGSKERRHKRSKEGHDRKHKRRRSEKREKTAPPATAGGVSLERLRAERDEREAREKKRAAAVLDVPVWAASGASYNESYRRYTGVTRGRR